MNNLSEGCMSCSSRNLANKIVNVLLKDEGCAGSFPYNIWMKDSSPYAV